MAMKRSPLIFSLPTRIRRPVCIQCRNAHHATQPTQIPKPIPFVPDVQTFLTLIGRNMSQHSSKIPSWKALFSLTSEQLRESGVEPARARRYLLWWRDRYRNGLMRIGGDLRQVKDGVAELRIVEVPSKRAQDRQATLTKDPGMRKMVINTPVTADAAADGSETSESVQRNRELGLLPFARVDISQAKPVAGVKIYHGNVIGGRGIEAVKGRQGVARLRVQEGLWEERRGHKVDGGERRKAEVRAKRRAAERKNAR